MSFIIYLDSNPFLQHLDIVLEREGSLNEIFNILSSNRTVIALRINCEDIGLFHDEVGKSLQLMLSSNKSLQCLEIKSQASNCTLLIKYLTTGLRRNNTLQELNVNIKLSENINLKELFEATDHDKYVHDKLQLYNEDSNMTNCFVMKARYHDITSIIKIHQSSLCQYLQESYINVFYTSCKDSEILQREDLKTGIDIIVL